jgi:hypothetical protein
MRSRGWFWGVGDSQTELPDSASHHGYTGTEDGLGKGYLSVPAARQGRYHGQRVYAGVAGKCEADGRLRRCNAVDAV